MTYKYHQLKNIFSSEFNFPFTFQFLHSRAIIYFAACLLSVVSQGAGSLSIYAGTGGTGSYFPDSTWVKQLDMVEVLGRAFHVRSKPDSIRYKGNGPFVSVIPIVGYAMNSGLTGGLTTSTSFFTSPEKNKFSNIMANAFYSQYQQYWMIATSNVFIEKLKIHIFGDWRYYKFPTKTFGIGTESSANDEVNIDYSYLRIYQLVFHEFAPNVFGGIGYNLDYHWNISSNIDSGLVVDQIRKYQKGTSTISSGISLNFQFDNRENAVNPNRGTFINLQYRPNFTFLGSNQNWQSLLLEARQYFPLPATSNNTLAFWSYNDFTLHGNPPYLDLPSNGWDDYSNTGRGYLQGRYTGNNFIYLESEYRFSLSRNGLFGAVVFGNAETYLTKIPSQMQLVIPGGGIGFRLKMNKKSNTNLAIDYGFGINGSRGLFFNLGEVF